MDTGSTASRKEAYEELRAAGGDDLDKLFDLLVEEIDQVLGRNEWALVKNWDNLPLAHAAAALRHCVALMTEMQRTRLFGQWRTGRISASAEIAVRILARSLVEAWLKGMYLVWAGEEALDALAGAYQVAVTKTDNAVKAYDHQVAAAAKTAARHNRRVRTQNAHITKRNEITPDLPPMPLLDSVPPPIRQKLALDLSEAVAGAQTDVTAEDLLLSNVARRVDQLADSRGDNVSAEAVYNSVYRLLSTYGEHISLATLDSYLNHDERLCIHVARDAALKPSADWLVETAMTWTAMLARRLFARKGADGDVAEYIEDLGKLRAIAKSGIE
jgi:hypothetical protein